MFVSIFFCFLFLSLICSHINFIDIVLSNQSYKFECNWIYIPHLSIFFCIQQYKFSYHDLIYLLSKDADVNNTIWLVPLVPSRGIDLMVIGIIDNMVLLCTCLFIFLQRRCWP